MTNYFKRTLNRQFTFLLLVVSLVIVLVGGVLAVYGMSIQSSYQAERERKLEKQEIVFEIDSHAKQMLIRARGYFAFQNNEELNALYREIDALNVYIERFSSLDLSAEELALLTEIKTTIHLYQTIHLPEALSLVSNNELDRLSAYANSGASDTVNQLIENTSNYVLTISEKAAEISSSYTQKVSILVSLFVIFLGVVLLILFIVLYKMIKQIGKPIQDVTVAAAELAIGKDVSLKSHQREDEIGVLSRTFLDMVEIIQQKEDEMTQQNIELKTQQEELEHKQDQLIKSLHETEEMQNVLLKYNSLNHAISVTLNKEDLFDELLTHLSDIYPVDKMLLFLTEETFYRARGIYDKHVTQLLNHFDQGIGLILREKNNYHLVEREVTDVERGLAEGVLTAYDLYIPIYSSGGELRAVFATNRVGKPFLQTEINELSGVMNHMSIAIEKVLMHEETEKERQLNQDIIDNVNEAIQFVDNEGHLLQFNQSFCQLIECEQKAQLKAPFSMWFQALEHVVGGNEAVASFYNEALKQDNSSVLSMNYEIHTKQKRIFKVYAEPVYHGYNKVGTIFVHRDITKQHEVEQMKSELVSTVSHELRTPLSSILGFTELMLHRKLKPEKQEKYLKTIHKEANRLTNLINDFLDLQRMESGGQMYTNESLDIRDLISEVLTRFEAYSEKHTLHFINLAEKTIIQGDSERIQQVITNIISNAIKFSPNGGDITTTLASNSTSLFVSVKDDGLGIPENEMKNLFRKFYRIDNSDRKKIGGTGLGLPICKEIVEAHNGTISVESKENEGSTFIIELPLNDCSQTLKAEGDSPKTILLLEDDQSLALLLAEELKNYGFNVEHFSNPATAITFVDTMASHLNSTHSPPLDAMVVDIMLGDELTGWDFIHKIKANNLWSDLPIFISSALDETEQLTRHSEIESYLTKPYPPSELSKTIIKTLNQDKTRGEILIPKRKSEI
ncbi:ATP-binding protein [Alkalihalophilus marmarensis]|uniref:ATP-binding protein n=1 Tax=Alkalihalophilus marmarensis TaxID=521377 RepID=UPI002DB9E945|nr:ATP-binding protein [Alkalihalophilus marmarensis]MEC2070641.1 ATP-binding protein [Alkalihalophilus marmarensis]